MPVANIRLFKGYPRPALERLLREVSSTFARITGSPMDRLQVWITEVDPALFALSGVPADQVVRGGDLGAHDMPFVRLILMKGRPQSQVDACIAEISSVVAEALGSDPSRVRMFVERAEADHWGIGGVPASILRRSEIEARKAG